MGNLDIIAVLWFLCLWGTFSQSTQPWHALGRKSLSQRMNAHRRAWFRVAARRELRMIDTAILGGLQNGTAFFASTTIFAIGGCFALLGATEEVLTVFRTLPLEIEPSPVAFEIKVIGLTALFAYAFFKFGWAYRLFNYSSILFGAIPPAKIVESEPETLDAAADHAADMNILAGQSFNAGLRTIFMSIGYLGWFAGPLFLMASSLLVIVVLVRRQFFSPAHDAAIEPGREFRS
ncbi:MAG: hypothetical protein CME90_14615 [Hoeflea sp.]|nr:hypothetical protein [Hoeflea sp.]|tara:strand:- start:14877 stop:15578 length:702 start_codon:yes stop_codon:yes gene_type:complete